MIYNLVSVKRVISKVFTDLDLQEETHRIVDFISWAGEALEKIGAFPTLETYVTGKGTEPLLKVENYQSSLPIGLHGIIQVAYSQDTDGPYYPMRTATGSFDTVRGMTKETTNLNTGEVTYTLEDEKENQTSFSKDMCYVITPGYIKVNFKEGYLMMAYTRIPVDADGYPLVPDNISFTEALYWYITMKVLYPQWKDGRVRDAVYYDARRSWNFYCKQAYGTAMMPNADQLESIKNSWLRLIPEIGEHSSFYSTLGQQQNIYNAN